MTYIVGLAQENVTAIFADCRETETDSAGMVTGVNGRLKTGLLFPGCIFGCCGNSSESTHFIVSFRQSISGEDHQDINLLWRHLRTFFRNQTFDPDRSFSLMLSVRHPDIGPRLYELDSMNKRIRPLDSPNVHTLGSGIKVLDRFVREEAPRLIGLGGALATKWERELESALTKIGDASRARDLFFGEYFEEKLRCCVLSYWLNKKSLCSETAELEAARVGGVFHFAFQTRSLENAQPVILFVFPESHRLTAETNEVLLRLYRVCHRERSLFVESWWPEEMQGATLELARNISLYVDCRTHDQVRTLTGTSLDQWLNELMTDYLKASEASFYEFSAVAPLNTVVGSEPAFGFGTNIRRDSIFNSDGALSEGIRELMSRVIAGQSATFLTRAPMPPFS